MAACVWMQLYIGSISASPTGCIGQGLHVATVHGELHDEREDRERVAVPLPHRPHDRDGDVPDGLDLPVAVL